MTYTRVSKLIPQSAYALKAPYAMTPKNITVHNTYNDVSALREIAYMSGNKNATSYHVAIDDKHAVEAIPFNRNAWHAGDGLNGEGNRKSIGIEICYSKSGGAKYEQAEANAIEYIAQVLKQYGWTIDNVKWHRDWSGKNCPHRILDEGRATAFRDSITRRLAELNYVAPPKAEVKSATTEVPKEELRMFKPTTDTLNNEMYKTLVKAHKDGILTSEQWAQKAKDGTLTLDDAVALTATIVRRAYLDADK